MDLLVRDAADDRPGQNVFSVDASGGNSVGVLVRDLDLASLHETWQAFHVTGAVTVVQRTLRLSFPTVAGMSTVSALAVTSFPSSAVPRTTFDETFNGPAGSQVDNRYWTPTLGSGWDQGVETYTAAPANVSLDGRGDLSITALRTPSGSYTSAQLTTKGKVTFGYGHVQATMKVPTGVGAWPAFWALGANADSVGWPTCGEIDVMESVGSSPATVFGHVHSLGNLTDPLTHNNHEPEASLGAGWNTGAALSAAFHTYAIDYQPGAVAFSIDGKVYFTATPEDLAPGEQWPFGGQPNYLMLDLAVGGAWAGSPSHTAFPLTLLVREVKIVSLPSTFSM